VTSTVAFFHAHPDDEALLTGGTMARLAAEGHRVVLITATAGGAGLASSGFGRGDELAAAREAELIAASAHLGCSRVVMLGYRDSGMRGENTADGRVFCEEDVDGVASRVAEVLVEEDAVAVTGYDPAGGYGHPDHLQVHRCARAAARIAGTPRLFEATVDRRALQRALRLSTPFRPRSSDFDPSRFDAMFADPATITHRIDVRAFIDAKRAALQTHASQSSADGADRTIAWMLRLPAPIFRLALGGEWFVEVGAHAGGQRKKELLGAPFT